MTKAQNQKTMDKMLAKMGIEFPERRAVTAPKANTEVEISIVQ